MNRKAQLAGAAALALALAAGGTAASDAARVKTLPGPRGLDIAHGMMTVGAADGSVYVVKKNAAGERVFKKIGAVAETGLAPATAIAPDGAVWALTTVLEQMETAGRAASGGATLYRMAKPGAEFEKVANIAKYQKSHPDEADLEGDPTESNPYGLAVTPTGKALVADAAGNDLLKVTKKGRISTVAVVLPRVVPVEAPPNEPRGTSEPTMLPSEAVVTSVAVGADGAYYIGELRGMTEQGPGPTGTSQVWRIKSSAHNAVCDPAHPRKGACKRYADDLTSIVSLDGGGDGAIYVAEMSKTGWWTAEPGGPEESQIGSVIKIKKNHQRVELKPGKLALPMSVAVGKHRVFASGNPFGPGYVRRVG